MSLFSSIWRDLEYGFKMGNMVRKLIIINVVVFVLVQIVHLVCNIATAGTDTGMFKLWEILNYFCFPADWKELLWHIWAPFTSIFLHEGFWHLVGNMIWLSVFGTIVGDLIGDRRVLPIYLLGGLAGGLLYFVSAQIMPYVGQHALGASAAVMAFGGAALMLNPDYRVALMFLGEVKIKYIVLVMFLLDLVGVSGMSNSGGHAAHIGGFVFGIVFVYALRDRSDWSEPVNRILDTIGNFFSGILGRFQGRRKPAMRVTHKRSDGRTAPTNTQGAAQSSAGRTPQQASHQEKLDQILDKIKQHGFDQLSQEEKDFLYDASRK